MKLDTAVWTPHARAQARERVIAESVVESILASPERVSRVRSNRFVAQGRVYEPEKAYLVRVVVDVDREPFEIVTVYRTSKLQKYGSPP